MQPIYMYISKINIIMDNLIGNYYYSTRNLYVTPLGGVTVLIQYFIQRVRPTNRTYLVKLI